RPTLPEFNPGHQDRVWSLETLPKQRRCVGLAGYVFDMSSARPEHAYLRDLLAGKDVTLFFLKRLDTSDGKETFDDVWRGRLSAAQRDCLNVYLHEFAREYTLAGRIDYDADLPSAKGASVLSVQVVQPSRSARKRSSSV